MSKAQKDKFVSDLEMQLRIDSHDIAVDERLEIMNTCFDKSVSSVIM